MPDESVFVIAEVGINHNGDLSIAKKLIDMAKQTGCDAVKFQKRTIDVVYSSDVLAVPRESPWGTTTRSKRKVSSSAKRNMTKSINIADRWRLTGLHPPGTSRARNSFRNTN